MIIEHSPQSQEPTTNTDKLADVPADLLEAAETFRQVCVKYRRQFFLTVNCDDDAGGKSYCFWSFVSEHMTPKDTAIDVKKGERRNLSPDEFHAFYNMISRGLVGVSDNRAVVAFIDPQERNNQV